VGKGLWCRAVLNAIVTLAMKASVSGVLCEADATMVKPGSDSENSAPQHDEGVWRWGSR
jgi:hypothetical protein